MSAFQTCCLPRSSVFQRNKPWALKNPLSLAFWRGALQEEDKPREVSGDVIRLDREHLKISAPLRRGFILFNAMHVLGRAPHAS